MEVSLRTATGLTLGPWDGTEVSELVRRASLSAHRAATEGRLWALWDGDRDALTAEDLGLLAALRTAGERGQLSLVYQPQIACASGRPSSVEALLRWSSPEHGVISPDRFVPLAERTGLIDRLTGWILSEALDAQQRWRAEDRRIPVSVNLSATTLTRTDLVEWILGELATRDLPPSCLTVELTETAAADLPQAMERLGELRSLGIRVAVDDFGTGHTSLAALASLPVDELKIDRSFIQRSSSSPAHEAIVATFSELAHRLGLIAVAEGVEDQATERRLVDVGFDLLQGYHLARPLPELELLGFVDSQGHVTGAVPGGERASGRGGEADDR